MSIAVFFANAYDPDAVEVESEEEYGGCLVDECRNYDCNGDGVLDNYTDDVCWEPSVVPGFEVPVVFPGPGGKRTF